MGRIADAAVARLDNAPATLDDLAGHLARAGATRAKNPVAAVRTALRADRRVVTLGDGRLASRAQALNGVVLTSQVSVTEHVRGAADIDGDFAPLTALGVSGAVLPTDIRPGDYVVARVADGLTGRIDLERASSHLERAAAEPLLVVAVRKRLADSGSSSHDESRVRLADALCDVTAIDADAFRRAGRPLSDVLRDAGFEVHLGWVAPIGTRWGALTELEIEALERGVADHLAADRPVEAAELQDRVVSLLRRHLPERVPDARRRLARVLARAGRARDGLSVLTGAFGFGDPEDRYEACLLAIRLGDTVAARRWAEEGMARVDGPGQAEVGACLEDLAGDLDAQAAYRGVQEWLPEPLDRVLAASRLASRLVAPHRSYLVGALVEQAFADLDEANALMLIAELHRLGPPGRDACLACASVLEGSAGDAARRATGGARSARRAWVQGLVSAAPVEAWMTSPASGSDQQHLIVAIGKEQARWAPLIVVIDQPELGGAVRDAFFLNDLAEPRFRRELLRPIAELGLPLRPIVVDQAIALLAEALARTAASGESLPALEYQPVVARLRRFVLPRTAQGADRVPADPDR
jgi:hypothetical protein